MNSGSSSVKRTSPRREKRFNKNHEKFAIFLTRTIDHSEHEAARCLRNSSRLMEHHRADRYTIAKLSDENANLKRSMKHSSHARRQKPQMPNIRYAKLSTLSGRPLMDMSKTTRSIATRKPRDEGAINARSIGLRRNREVPPPPRFGKYGKPPFARCASARPSKWCYLLGQSW